MKIFSFLLVLMACQVAESQSIVVSGSRNSIIVSGKSEAVGKTSSADRLPYTDEEMRGYLGHPVPPKYLVPKSNKVPLLQNDTEKKLTGLHFVYFYQNNCGGCLAVDRAQTIEKLREAGIPIVTYNLSEEQNQRWVDGAIGFPKVEVVPQFWLVDGDRNELKRVFKGVFSFEELSKHHATPKPQPQIRPQQQRRPRLPVVMTQWGEADLETYESTHVGCNCQMCISIRALIQSMRNSPEYQPTVLLTDDSKIEDFGQEPTTLSTLEKVVGRASLATHDVLADLGCGDGRVLVAAVKRYGCKGIGVEIDPVKAQEARELVEKAGLSSRIEIYTGDVLDFDPEEYGVTATFVYLYPNLLSQMKDQFKTSHTVISPFHAIPGLPMKKDGDLWIYKTQ